MYLLRRAGVVGQDHIGPIWTDPSKGSEMTRYLRLSSASLLVFVTVGVLLLRSSPAGAEDAPPTKSVTATGAGLTPEKATAAALRNAVEQGIAGILDPKSLLANEAVIRDTVLKNPDLFIVRHEVLKRWTEEGLSYCRISAEIQTRELRARLNTIAVLHTSLDGESLGLQLASEMNAKKDAAGVFRSFLEETRSKALFANLTAKPSVRSGTSPSQTALVVPIEIGVDLGKWRALVNEWLPKLRMAARATTKATLSLPPLPPVKDARDCFAFGSECLEERLTPERWFGTESKSSGDDYNNIGIFKRIVSIMDQARRKGDAPGIELRTVAVVSSIEPGGMVTIDTFALDRDLVCGLLTPNLGNLGTTVSLVDNSGSTVSSGAFRARTNDAFSAPREFQGDATTLIVVPGVWGLGTRNPGFQAIATSWTTTLTIPLAGIDVSKLQSVKLEPTYTMQSDGRRHCK